MRVQGTGQIDRSKPVSFRFDGRTYTGFQGDTLASALIANDVKVVGRSFKYHRPRGVFSDGSHEPNALVGIHRGNQIVPNTRATMQELHSDLNAAPQNFWGSLKWDALELNDFLSPFIGAGFYYKTFMWPKSFWEKVYEPFIRKAAGLGQLSMAHNTDLYEKAFAFCDLLVIGSGPSGLAAALTAGRSGANVILCEEDFRFGGRLNFEKEEIGETSASEWAQATIAELETLPNVRLMRRTTVTGAYDGGTYAALERVAHHVAQKPAHAPVECFWRIVAKRAIYAAGAIERSIAFANNDRPGVMLASAVRGYLNRFGAAPGKSVAIFGNNDSAFQTAKDAEAAGLHVSAYIDTRPDCTLSGNFRIFKGAQVSDVFGRNGVNAVNVTDAGGTTLIEADCLAVSGGWNPTVHLTCHMNGRPEWRDDISAFVPVPDMIPGLEAVGAAAGQFSTKACLEAGATAASNALKALGIDSAPADTPKSSSQPYAITPFWEVPGKKRAWLDFQNDVTTKDVRLSAQENFRSVEHMKRYTTQGMAPDQGKNSNVAALAILADATGQSIPETGTTTYRPPFAPVTIAAMGAGGQGEGFAPQRFTTSDMRSREMGAPMIEAGLWYRPSYFPQPGETHWRQSCNREVQMVRNAVGISDVSTLGKIDIRGKDAGAFLDFVYTGTFSKLKVGRAKYGLMLREDGLVMDDGTTARLGKNHFLMTTTTAAAGQVMRHLEFVHQCLCPEMDVQFISVTEQWAQFAIAGPKAPELINQLLDDATVAADLPFMGVTDCKVDGIAARLFRISFSGELGYELAVPARYGESLFDLLLKLAEPLSGGAYGMEALNVLRIEKGFITHAEIDGRVTAFDLGMSGMMSSKKDFVGKTAAARSGLIQEDRRRLVGLRPVNPSQEITAGGFVFNQGSPKTREVEQGYSASVCYSPTLNSFLGLAFIKGGPQRIGDKVILADHVREKEALCEICDPVFFDKAGDRARG